jgi:D-glycero-D-manno-heptose 1,7-bisphosphate phosphatase
MESPRHRAVFLDRDGVLNEKPENGEYVTRCSELRLFNFVGDVVADLQSAGFFVFVVTNQRGIALGKMDLRSLSAIHEYIANLVEAKGGKISKFYCCPHDISEHCCCRKPNPGMLLEAAAEFRIDLSRSWMVGDTGSDIEAGSRVGCQTILIGETIPHSIQPSFLAASLREAAALILHMEATST